MNEYITFTNPAFIFRFLPLFLIVYLLTPLKHKNKVALLFSYVFYAFGEPVYIVLLALLTVVNYLIAKKSLTIPKAMMDRYGRSRRRKYMAIACVIDIAVLVIFKVLAIAGPRFLISGASNEGFISGALHLENFALPLGLSFYIFKMISYQIDVKNGELYAKPGFLDTALYFSLFPQVSQGPIMRYDEGRFYRYLDTDIRKIESGLKLFAVGLCMKVLVADRVGILFNDLSMYGYDSISTPLSWLGAIAYSMELYLDFYGYSLMSSGILVMMGYDFIRNFDHPYASISISEFYRRWHMTLGRFFRDYVYFPMGGSRCKKSRIVLNLMIVWALTGIWHGNGLNFLIWGLVLGLFIVMEKFVFKKNPEGIKLILRHVYVLIVIPITWIIFAIGDLQSLGLYLSRMFPFWGSMDYVDHKDYIAYLKDYAPYLIAGIFLILPVSERLYVKLKNNGVFILILAGLFFLSIYFSASSVNNPFMYLNF